MEKGICFLDIDGVVNTKRVEYKKGVFYTYYYQWHDRKVNNMLALLWLSKLCIEQNLDIVIISDWANYLTDDLELKEILYNNGLIYRVEIKDIIRGGMRSKSIIDYLNSNQSINKYLILDDKINNYNLNNEGELLKEHLVLCDEDYGFVGEKKYKEAISILHNSKTLIKTKE